MTAHKKRRLHPQDAADACVREWSRAEGRLNRASFIRGAAIEARIPEPELEKFIADVLRLADTEIGLRRFGRWLREGLSRDDLARLEAIGNQPVAVRHDDPGLAESMDDPLTFVEQTMFQRHHSETGMWPSSARARKMALHSLRRPVKRKIRSNRN